MPLPPWNTITEAQLKTRISAVELDAYRKTFDEPGGEDPVQAVIDIVCERVRGSVGACSSNLLGQPGEVPSTLMDTTLSLIVWRMMERGMARIQDPTGSRKASAEKAERVLESVERCEGPVIPQPLSDPTTLGPDGLSIVYTVAEDRNSRGDQDGI